jgi:Fur family ferric uptake transcriptional regulator
MAQEKTDIDGAGEDRDRWRRRRLRSMAQASAESWAGRAQRVLTENKRHTGAARRAVLELLDSQTCALSAIEIEDLLRGGKRPVGRASIYRILDELERLHLVQKVQVGQAMSRFEPVREDHEHHHHLVCDNCGTVIPFTDSELERAIQKLSRRVPMRVDEHEIVLHGACDDCSG